jgi:photosystem II stability/assembly factor-like uncharacterized protein
VTHIDGGMDAVARSLTHRLIAACEQEPSRSLDSRRGSAARTLAMLIATVAAVAAVGLAGTSILRGQTSHTPIVGAPTPPIVGLPTPTASAQPTPTPSQAPDTIINNLTMYTPSTGWAQRQSDGAILRTTDSVQRWIVTMPAIGSADVIAAAFVDADTARLLTARIPPESGGVTAETVQAWATDNGGTTWAREGSLTAAGASMGSPAGTLDFVDPEDGWFSLSGGADGSSTMDLFRTQDAGARWTQVVATSFMPSPGQTSDIPLGCDKNPAVFADAATGWITAACNGGSAFLYVSHDGGVSWRSQSLGNTSSEYGYWTYPPQFVSPSDGYMIGSKGGVPPTVVLFVTTDGGQAWSQWRTPESALDASDFVNGTDGWVLMNPSDDSSNDSSLWVTHNAGRTWTDLGLNTELDGLNLDFLSAQIGWAYPSEIQQPPSGPELLRTIDGGRTWAAVTPTIVQP